MLEKYLKNGDSYGCHRVIEPKGVFPQPALKINNSTNVIWDNEILVNVESLNIDSASFSQIKRKANGKAEGIKDIILDIVQRRGKMHNPDTGSGGVFIGRVDEIGDKLINKCGLKRGDKIVSLVSLSLTPLQIHEIYEVKTAIDQVKVNGKAVLFESGIYTKLPEDIPETLALAVLDVCGAPAQTARLVKCNDTVVIIGAGGKSGILCAYEARKVIGNGGKIIGITHSTKSTNNIQKIGVCDSILELDAQNASLCYKEILKVTENKLANLVINCANVPDTELSSILMCREMGKVYFFSMATSFTTASLGAEGIGKDIDMIIGNGYTKGHAEMALNILRESKEIRSLYDEIYNGFT